MSNIIRKILYNKIKIAFLGIFLFISIINFKTIFYSIISLVYWLILLVNNLQSDPSGYFFFEYWVAAIYLLIVIIILIVSIIKSYRRKKEKRKGFFTNLISESVKVKLVKIVYIFLFVIVSVGFLSPLISPDDPYEISDIRVKKYKKPFSNVKYLIKEKYELNENNIPIDYSSKIREKIRIYKKDIFQEKEKIYFDSLKRVDSKLFVYQGNFSREINTLDLIIINPEIYTKSYILGTDEFGRDLLSRIIYGTRVSIGIGVFALLLSIFIGVSIGLLCGFKGGVIDSIIMRIVDIILSFPTMFLVLLVIGLFGNSIILIIIILGVTTWMDVARLVRTQTQNIRNENYILAAKASGFSGLRIIFHHILPNVLTPVLVNAAFRIGNIILAESALSFLGVGVNPPIPSWGSIMNNGKDVLLEAWWISTFPGLLITVTVIMFNVLGENLREQIGKIKR